MSDDIIKRLRRDLELGSTASGRVFSASPDNIAALLDRLDAAQRECERLRSESKAQLEELDRIDDALGTNEGPSAVDHIVILKTENERLREDASRYRWIKSRVAGDSWLMRFAASNSGTSKSNYAIPLAVYEAKTGDAAIDAARREK